jgi:hypothetical protein
LLFALELALVAVEVDWLGVLDEVVEVAALVLLAPADSVLVAAVLKVAVPEVAAVGLLVVVLLAWAALWVTPATATIVTPTPATAVAAPARMARRTSRLPELSGVPE